MLSRVSRIPVSRAEGARVTRREPGTWENSGFSASTKPLEVSLNLFLLERRLRYIRLLRYAQWCFVKDQLILATCIPSRLFPIQIFARGIILYALKVKDEKRVRMFFFFFTGIREATYSGSSRSCVRIYLLSSHRNRLLSLNECRRRGFGEPRAFFHCLISNYNRYVPNIAFRV